MFDNMDIPKKHYDLHASLKLIGNKKSVARELAMLLKAILPEFVLKLRTAFENNDIQEIQTIIHKLHGGICYVAAPRLQYLVEQLETACKQHPEKVKLITPYVIPSINALEAALVKKMIYLDSADEDARI